MVNLLIVIKLQNGIDIEPYTVYGKLGHFAK